MKNKILSIVIPYYKETKEQVFPLLSSINNQIGVDFDTIECIMVNDGAGNIFHQEFLDIFSNLNIQDIYMEENKGPGVARQVGLDAATGEYVMFCDADDILHSVGVIGAFIQEISLSKCDVITSPWLEELKDNNTGTVTYLNHDNESTWMHGKAFKRLFLEAYNICFHPDLRVHEDSYFLSVVMSATKTENRKLLFPTYVWKWNDDSITRDKDNEYTYSSMSEFCRAVALSFEKVEHFNPAQMYYKVTQFIMNQYFSLHQDHWLEPDKKHWRIEAEKALVKYMSPYFQYFTESPIELVRKVYNEERAKSFGMGIESETFEIWINRIWNREQDCPKAV